MINVILILTLLLGPFSATDIVTMANAMQGECNGAEIDSPESCYAVVLTILNRYKEGQGTIRQIVTTYYYGYDSTRVPKRMYINMTLEALKMYDFTNGSVFMFSYSDSKNLGIVVQPTYKTKYFQFFNFWPVGKSRVVIKATSPVKSLENKIKRYDFEDPSYRSR